MVGDTAREGESVEQSTDQAAKLMAIIAGGVELRAREIERRMDEIRSLQADIVNRVAAMRSLTETATDEWLESLVERRRKEMGL